MKKIIILLIFILFMSAILHANNKSIELNYGLIDPTILFLFTRITLTYTEPPTILNFNKIEKSETININYKIILKQLWAKEWDYYLKFSIIKFDGDISYLSSKEEYYALATNNIVMLYFAPIGIEYNFCKINFIDLFFAVDIGIIYMDWDTSGFIKGFIEQGLAIWKLGNYNYLPVFLDCNYTLGLKINFLERAKLTIKTGMIIPVAVLISFGFEFSD